MKCTVENDSFSVRAIELSIRYCFRISGCHILQCDSLRVWFKSRYFQSPLSKDVSMGSTYKCFKTPETVYFMHFIERFTN